MFAASGRWRHGSDLSLFYTACVVQMLGSRFDATEVKQLTLWSRNGWVSAMARRCPIDIAIRSMHQSTKQTVKKIKKPQELAEEIVRIQKREKYERTPNSPLRALKFLGPSERIYIAFQKEITLKTFHKTKCLCSDDN